MAVITSNELGKEILKALNLPSEGVKGIGIRIHVNEVATVTIERMLLNDSKDDFVSVFDEYELRPKV